MLKLTKLLDDFKTIDDVKENIIYPQLNTQYQCDYLHYLFSKFVKNKNTKKILDVGCGYGRHALMLSKLN
jgi:tRNA1(Val) A37 N6-methylase TrmN6